MTPHEKQELIEYLKQGIAIYESAIQEKDCACPLKLIKQRRAAIAELFTLHGYARHTGNGDVLRIASMPDNINILFVDHTIKQPIGWYEPATEQEYFNYQNRHNYTTL